MNKLTPKTWLAIAVVLGLIIFAYFYSSSGPQTGGTAAPSTAATSTAAAPSQPGVTSSGAKVGSKAFSIYLTSPLKGEKWALGVTHTIRWNTAAQSAGQIYLVSATTGVVVGWINPSTGTDQTYYEWSTRDVSVTRDGGARKDVGVGDYVIKIKFDNKTIPEVTSGVFSIAYQSEIKSATYSVYVKNFTVTPSSVSIKKGDQVSIMNNDDVPLTISVVGRSGMTIQPGQSEVFDTANLSQGPYYLYSEQYPSLKLTVNVQ